MFVTGPDVVKTVTNEIVTAEELGGASTHTKKSSVADGAYDNDVEALIEIRRMFDFLPLSSRETPPVLPTADAPDRIENALDTLIPDNPNKPYDMTRGHRPRSATKAISSRSRPTTPRTFSCGFIRLNGSTVGVVANQPMVLAGVLDSDASRKAARFVRFCDCLQHPDPDAGRRARLPAGCQPGI